MSGRTMAWWAVIGVLVLVILSTLSIGGGLGLRTCYTAGVEPLNDQGQPTGPPQTVSTCETDYGSLVPWAAIMGVEVLLLAGSIVALWRSSRADRYRYD